jgi:hypothetical protein
MSLNAQALRLLAEKGLTASDIAELAEALEVRRDPTAADRMRRYRARKSSVTVTRNVTAEPAPNDIYTLTPTEPGLSNDNPHPLPIRVVEAWNSGPAKSGATVSRTLNAKRKAALRVRVREHGEDAVFEAIRNLSGSKFHCGDNDRGWKANIGWLLTNPENFQKALEMEAPPDAVRSLSVAERAAAADRSADLFERMGRHDEAEERRALAATLRKAA